MLVLGRCTTAKPDAELPSSHAGNAKAELAFPNIRTTAASAPFHCDPLIEISVQLDSQRPTGVQNRQLSSVFSATQPRKGNGVIEIYGAGDGNRTHVQSSAS